MDSVYWLLLIYLGWHWAGTGTGLAFASNDLRLNDLEVARVQLERKVKEINQKLRTFDKEMTSMAKLVHKNDQESASDLENRLKSLEEKWSKNVESGAMEDNIGKKLKSEIMKTINETLKNELKQQRDDIHDIDERLAKMEEKTEDKPNLKEEMKKMEVDILKSVNASLKGAKGKGSSSAFSHVLRSCYEYAQYGITKNDFYSIDPDGVGFGRPPFKVYCDFDRGSTEVMHDSEKSIKVQHCQSRDCYKMAINYKASRDQIESLISISNYCTQDIQFDCFLAPLFDDNRAVGKWLNRNGEPETYFDGAHHGEQMCACSRTKSCAQHEDVCNCDSQIPLEKSDFGVITNSSALPITGFVYGRLYTDLQKAAIKFSRLRCFGQVDLSKVGVASSCRALKLAGVTHSGYYDVTNDPESKVLRKVFCNFKLSLDNPELETLIGELNLNDNNGKEVYHPTSCRELKEHGELRSGIYDVMTDTKSKITSTLFCNFEVGLNDPGLETLIGKNDLKDSVVFEVHISKKNGYIPGGIITYSETTINLGGGMNPTNGKFTVPRDGTYVFQATGDAEGDNSARVQLFVNGNVMEDRYDQEYYSYIRSFNFFSTLILKKGDTVWLWVEYANDISLQRTPFRFMGYILPAL